MGLSIATRCTERKPADPASSCRTGSVRPMVARPWPPRASDVVMQ